MELDIEKTWTANKMKEMKMAICRIVQIEIIIVFFSLEYFDFKEEKLMRSIRFFLRRKMDLEFNLDKRVGPNLYALSTWELKLMHLGRSRIEVVKSL